MASGRRTPASLTQNVELPLRPFISDLAKGYAGRWLAADVVGQQADSTFAGDEGEGFGDIFCGREEARFESSPDA